MCLVRYTSSLVLLVFSSSAGQWLADPVAFDMFGGWASQRYYAHGCFCWEISRADKLLVLDARRMHFSAIDLPPAPGRAMRDMAIVETGEGRFGMFTISDQIRYGESHLLYEVQRTKDGNGAGQWQSKSVISLPANYRYGIMGVAGGYMLLYGYPKDDREIVDYFSLNLQTFKIEWFFQTGNYIMLGDLYADFPPPLSPPTI